MGCTSFVLFGCGAGTVFVEGRRLARGDAVILRSGSRVEIVSHGECVAATISVSESEWCRKAPFSEQNTTPLRGGGELMACKPDAALALLNGIDSAVSALTPHRDAFLSPGTWRPSADGVLALLADALVQPRPLAAELRKSARRRIGVERAREYIVNHLVDPIRLADLCRYAHLQARSLEYGFGEIVGLSPVSYVKMLRLGEAHRRLLSRSCSGLSISEVALDSGFWHLSQFAADYKKLFMESPSATRQRSAGLSRVIELRARSMPLVLPVLDAVVHELARETRAAWLQFARSPSATDTAASN
jgi:AraC-like DNA-binding protein